MNSSEQQSGEWEMNAMLYTAKFFFFFLIYEAAKWLIHI